MGMSVRPALAPQSTLAPPAQALREGVDTLGLLRVLGVEDEDAVEVAIAHMSHHGSCKTTGQMGCGVEDGDPPSPSVPGGCGPADQ